MRSEASTPIDQQFQMLAGRLDPSLVDELDSSIIPEWIDRLAQKNEITSKLQSQFDLFSARDRSSYIALYSLYSYADIPLGRRYNALWSRVNPHNFTPLLCEIDHAIFEGWFPAESITHGHKHILFARLLDGSLSEVPLLRTWSDIGTSDWSYAISDREVIAHLTNGKQD